MLMQRQTTTIADTSSRTAPAAILRKQPLLSRPDEPNGKYLARLERAITAAEADIGKTMKRLERLERERAGAWRLLVDLKADAGKAHSAVGAIGLELADIAGRIKATNSKIERLDSEIESGQYDLLSEKVLAGKETKRKNLVIKAVLLEKGEELLMLEHAAKKARAEALSAQLDSEARRMPGRIELLDAEKGRLETKLDTQLQLLEANQAKLVEMRAQAEFSELMQQDVLAGRRDQYGEYARA